MDEREKIKFRIELGIQDHGEIFHRELIKALNHEKNRFSTEEMDKTLVDCIADALIAANIGDVTTWKERAEKHRVIALPDGTIKQLYGDEEVKDIARQRDEYKHRAEVAEEERDKAQKSLVALCNEVAKIAIASDLVAIDNNTHKFFECKSDWSGTCKKCYFACENYPFDMGRCEHNQYHWLNQQAEREIEEEKK